MRAALPGWIASPHLLLVLMVLIFSVNIIIGRAVVGQMPPYALGFVRWSAASVLILPFAWTHVRHDAQRIKASWRRLALCGVSMPLIGAGLTYVALTKTVAVNAGIIQTALPVFTVVLAWIFLGARVGARQALGMAIATAGVLAIVLRGDPATLINLELNSGDLILLIATTGLAIYAVALKGVSGGIHRLSLLIVIFAIGALAHAPFAAAELIRGEAIALTATTVAALLFVATLPSVVAIMLWNYGIERLGPARAGTYMYLNGVFTAALAFVLLGEALHPYHGLGTVLIVAGIWYSERHPRR